MDFLAISVWIFDFLVLFLLPLVSLILLAIGLIRLFQILPDTIKRYAGEQADKLSKGMKGRD